MRTHMLLAIALVIGCLLVGCQRSTPSPTIATSPQTSTAPAKDTDSATVSLLTSNADAEYQSALLESLDAIHDRRYSDALISLQAAQTVKDTEVVRQQIDKVQGLQLQQESFDRTIAEIQAVIDQGQGELASQLVVLALGQFQQEPEAGKLAALKRLADALQQAAKSDILPLFMRYRSEADAAVKENNLRAAVLALEQAVVLKPDGSLQQQLTQLRDKLNKYDVACEKARELRKDTNSLEEAIAALQEAGSHWDTLTVRQELADLQLALDQRRERLAISPFAVHGDAQLSSYCDSFVDELLPHFRKRYDLVERGLANRLLEESKVDANDILLSEQGRADLSKLAKARYIVVGSISSLAGVTVHARLIDLRTGLIVQTAKVTGSSTNEVSKKLSVLAAQLLMTDDEKLAYDLRQAERDTAVAPMAAITPPSELPSYNPQSLPQPIQFSTARLPSFGSITVEDYDRLPVMQPDGNTALAPAFLEQERPLRQRLLGIQLELGDNHFRRGQYRDAYLRYQMARELDPASLDILGRLSLCQQYLPPVQVDQQARKARLAILPFYVAASPQTISPACSAWTPANLVPYFASAYDVIDPDEVHWMMSRLGVSMGDIVRDVSIRRWLGRAVGVRYFVLGRLQPLQGIAVTTVMLDVEQGWETGRAQVVVQNLYELKYRLNELARLTMMSPAERARLERDSALYEAEWQRALEADRRGQFQLALDLGKALKSKHPFSIRVNVLLSKCEENARHAAWQQARQQEQLKQHLLAEAVQRRQAELLLTAERLREQAARQAAQIAEVERRRQQDLAVQQMLSQARIAIQVKNFSVAVQLFEGACAMRPADESLQRESAALRAQLERDRRLMFLAQQAQAEEARRRQWTLDMSTTRQLWTREREQFQLSLQPVFHQQQQLDQSNYTRLLDQAQRLKAQGRLDEAAYSLQLAKRLHPTEDVERLLTDTLLLQARQQAKAEDAARLAELERRLAQETIRRKQAEDTARNNWKLYQTALQLAQEAERSKNYSAAQLRYQEAGKLFQTETVVNGLRGVQLAQAEEARLLKAQKEAATQQKTWKQEGDRVLKLSQEAEKSGKYDTAISALRKCRETDPGNIELTVALNKLELARIKSMEVKQSSAARDQASQVKSYLAQAQARAKAKQFEAAFALVEAAEKLMPDDSQIKAQRESINKLKQADIEALAIIRKKEEDTRRLAHEKIQQEEKAKEQAAKARKQAEVALAGGDWKTAEAALATMKRLAPSDPAFLKLSQELAAAQSQAARAKSQQDIRAKLEAEAQVRQVAMNQKNTGKLGEILKNAQTSLQKKDFATAEKLLGEALALDGTNLAVGRLQRELQVARQAEDRARSAMSASDRKKQEEEHRKKKEQFTKVMKEGKEALAEEDLDKAMKLFTEARRLNPDDADAALYLGMARRDIDRANAEKEAARQAVEEEKRRQAAEAKAEMSKKNKADAEIRQKLAMDEEARKQAELLKTMNQQQFDTALSQGKQLLTARKYEEALTAFQKAQQLQPTNKTVAELIAQANRMKAEAFKQMPPVKEQPQTPSVAQLVAQASMLQKQQKWEEALKLYQQVLLLNPNDAAGKAGVRLCEFQANFEAGRAALAKKDKDAAIRALEAALKVVPGHQEAQKLLKQARELK